MNEPPLQSDTVRSTFDRSEKPPSIAVVEAIAAIEDTPPTDLSITLHDFIKPTSLNEPVNSNSDVSVTFSVDQYQIQVNGNTITVTPC
ncbi:HalOD1 output domain-containing protein [Saliphagus sp. LR7]|uniref:HalOD1 output domain-containing protein n=1 Tax=Saliphagus sp. LR7 TaxID=2282654 RepID=UPI000DF7CED6|nr:HalOD1 output domain-containing protein [Saliphagus sp. LR7]